jgi:1-acyl-sn-glycerol-3-phosphate acyltransferase
MTEKTRNSGGLKLMMQAAYHTIWGISAPTVAEATIGRLTQEKCDERLHDWAHLLVKLTRTTLTVRGTEHIPQKACVVMSNHLSYADIPLIYAALPDGIRLRMVAKRELFYTPIWGRAMRASGFIPIVRSDRKRAIESLNVAKQALSDGTYIWIAPEGTRSRTGELGTLKKGGFILARDTGVPILPMNIAGSGDIMPPQGWRLYRDNDAVITFRPLIKTAGRSIEEIMADVARDIAVSGSPTK